MKKQIHLIKSLVWLAVITLTVLSIPFIAMQYTNEVTWSVVDFIIMGCIVYGAGLAFVLIAQYAESFIHKLAILGAVGSTLLLVWVNLAVGLIGSGPHAGNWMYLGILAVVFAGSIGSHFTVKGMEQTMFATVGALGLIVIVALLSGMQNYPGSSVEDIIGVNVFFAGLFGVSGLLFRYAGFQAKRKLSH